MTPHLPDGLPAAAVVDLAAIRHNVGVLAERAQAPVMAVVKADAYGHGLVPCARAALEGGAAWLGVARLAEALELRAAGIQAPVLAWLVVPGDRFVEAVGAGVELGVSARWALDEIADAARAAGRPAQVQLKADTGLNRNGVAPADWDDVVRATLKHQADGVLTLTGVFSHYAWADAPQHPTVAAQTERLHAAIARVRELGGDPGTTHLANSAATVTNPDARFDLVRPGLAVYGLSPVPDLSSAEDLGLVPAMTYLARVANVKPAPAGEGVSYGHVWTTTRDTTLALLPVGYADGVPRHATDAGPVELGGRRHRIAGRVCMDQVVIDLTRDHADAGDVHAGDVAVLFGVDGPTAQDWADAAGTISYEIVTRVGARVPRIHVGGTDA